jgi:soluble lytic murein transglycosylase
MTIRNFLVMNIPDRWYRLLVVACLLVLALVPSRSAPLSQPASQRAPVSRSANLASLVRTYRESPSPARLAAVQTYASAHAKDSSGALARLALGVAAYEQKDYPSAITNLQKLAPAIPQIADYAAYYLGAARLEAKDQDFSAQDLSATHTTGVRSPLSGKAWILEARALQARQPAEAVRLLREHYAELPQPEGDINLADSYQAANDLAHAADFYQRVYYQYLTGDAAARAAAALITLQDIMGAAYPAPVPGQMLHRADRLMETRDYARAASEYQSLIDRLVGVERDQARVRAGAADLLRGNPASASSYLRSLQLPDSEADAERLYYLVECARKLGDDNAMMSAVQELAKYPTSPWRLKALTSAANRYLVANRPDDFLPLYRAAYEDFPADPSAGLCHWKVAFQAYLRNQPDAVYLLREHLRNYPSHPTAGAALYFLGRSAERDNDFGAAKAYYQQLSQSLQNQYYAMLARDRLQDAQVGAASPSTEAAAFAGSLRLAQSNPVPSGATVATNTRIERSRLLRSSGLNDLADSELRFGSRTDGQPVLLGMEMAGAADAPHLALRIMKSVAPDYLSMTFTQAPRRFWELLFPLPYRGDLEKAAKANGLDPYLVAGLIRQESEFNPQALSHANAYGLTQVLPGTGRQMASRAGVQRFASNQLFQPATNLKIGTSILRSMLDHNGGRIEQTLAAYNAGPTRAAQWVGWGNYREPAEFVEAIPFTETRDYVQAVLRNSDIYRRLYR